MKTASYFSYHGPGRIGISVGAPRGCPPGYRMYRTLAPRRPMLTMPFDQYRAIFIREILGRLDPHQVEVDLHRLAGGAEPVLLCFERPPFTVDNWCHRRMVAEWFAETLSLDVPELVGTGGAD